MSITTFQQHAQNAATFKGDILGQLCWYSIPEETIEHGLVTQTCKEHGIEAYAPSPPRPPDVFRRACKNTARRVGRKEDPQRYTYEFKIIDKDQHSIFVKLVRETVDAATNKGIDWHRMANVTFQRDTETIDVVELPDIDGEGADAVRALRQTFNAENGKINSAHIRRMINEVLRACMSTAVRPSGGIYFVTEDNSEKVKKVADVVNELPGGASMHLLPLVDTSDQRHMLQNAVESELESEIDSQLAEISDILKAGKKISQDKYMKISAQMNRSGRKGGEYAKLLSSSLSVFEQRKQVGSDMLAKLANNVEVKS